MKLKPIVSHEEVVNQLQLKQMKNEDNVDTELSRLIDQLDLEMGNFLGEASQDEINKERLWKAFLEVDNTMIAVCNRCGIEYP